jgi:hypothetical protein
MNTFNSFEELVQSTQNQPLDVTSNPNGTVTPGVVQPPASVPAPGSEGNPPGWHNSLAQRVTNLEGKVDKGFAGIRTEMNQKFTQVGQALDEIKKRLPQK